MKLPYPFKFYVMAFFFKFNVKVDRHPHSIVWNQDAKMLPVETRHRKLTKKKLPNVIFIITDDLGMNDLSGGAGVATPYIDSIRENGVIFDKSYAGQATCAPSRASMMTGRYSTRFGFEFTPLPWQLAYAIASAGGLNKSHPTVHKPIYFQDAKRHVPHFLDMNVPINETFISQILHEQGYRNYYLGKFHLGQSFGTAPWNRSYDEFLGFIPGASLYLDVDDPNVVNAPVGETIDAFLFTSCLFMICHNNLDLFTPDQYMTDYISNNARDAIIDHVETFNKSRPFFMTVAYNAPHNPLQALKSDYDSPELAGIEVHHERVYAAMIKAVDRGVGTILQTLKDVDELENTLVIFTSDNGAAGYINIPNRNSPYRGWKSTFFEGGIRVPLFMQWPAMIPKATSYDKPTHHVDIFSTIIGAAQAEEYLPEGVHYDGRNLLDYIPTLQGKGTHLTDLPHESLFWRSGSYKAILKDGWKLQISKRPNKMWLFNLNEDPTEQINIIDVLCQDFSECKKHANGTSTGHGVVVRSELDDYTDYSDIIKSCYTTSSSVSGNYDTFCGLLTLIEEINGQQAPPIWPALVTTSISIDHISSVQIPTDEYVYWEN